MEIYLPKINQMHKDFKVYKEMADRKSKEDPEAPKRKG